MATLAALDAERVRGAGVFVICMILAIGVHEFAHAYAAHKLGDPVPEGQGRLTLNPIAHADPVGTLGLPLVLALFSPGMMFGWGRPVMTEPRNYSRKVSMRGGMALVAFAGPLSNLLQALVAAGLIAGFARAGWMTSTIGLDHPLLVYFYLNLVLFGFNLLPIHPLDGGKVLAWLLGPKHQYIDDFMLRYGGMVLVVLIFAPMALGIPSILGALLRPIFSVGQALLTALL